MVRNPLGPGRQNFQSDLKWWKKVGMTSDFFLRLGISWKLPEMRSASPHSESLPLASVLKLKMYLNYLYFGSRLICKIWKRESPHTEHSSTRNCCFPWYYEIKQTMSVNWTTNQRFYFYIKRKKIYVFFTFRFGPM